MISAGSVGFSDCVRDSGYLYSGIQYDQDIHVWKTKHEKMNVRNRMYKRCGESNLFRKTMMP